MSNIWIRRAQTLIYIILGRIVDRIEIDYISISPVATRILECTQITIIVQIMVACNLFVAICAIKIIKVHSMTLAVNFDQINTALIISYSMNALGKI